MDNLYLPGQRPGLENDEPPIFQRQRYILNGLGLSGIAAALARLIYGLHRAECLERKYDNAPAAGYIGWIEHPRYGILAFRRADGGLQFKW